MENNTVSRLKELGIYEHVTRHNAGLTGCTGVQSADSIMPPLPDGDITVFSPDNRLLKDNYIYVYPTAAGEVKALAGVPDKIANKNAEQDVTGHLEMLRQNETQDLRTLAYDYLIVSEGEMIELLNESPYDICDVKKYITDHTKAMPVLCAGGTLEVKDGQVIEIKNTPTAIFENVIIHGSGSIRPDSKMKIVITKKLDHIQ